MEEMHTQLPWPLRAGHSPRASNLEFCSLNGELSEPYPFGFLWRLIT